MRQLVYDGPRRATWIDAPDARLTGHRRPFPDHPPRLRAAAHDRYDDLLYAATSA